MKSKRACPRESWIARVGVLLGSAFSRGRARGVAGTRTVTVLFTDMVGSTALSSSLDPEAADRVRQGHFSVLRQAIAATDGAEVKNLGDGLMAVFASSSAAIACAVAMQQ